MAPHSAAYYNMIVPSIVHEMIEVLRTALIRKGNGTRTRSQRGTSILTLSLGIQNLPIRLDVPNM